MQEQPQSEVVEEATQEETTEAVEEPAEEFEEATIEREELLLKNQHRGTQAGRNKV